MEDTGRSLFFEGTGQPLQKLINTNTWMPFSQKTGFLLSFYSETHQSTHAYTASNQHYRALPIKMNGHQMEMGGDPPKQK